MRELSNVKGTIGKILKDNMAAIAAVGSQTDLIHLCENLLKDSTNKDKENFLTTLRSKRGLMKAQEYVCNYLLKGDGLGTI